MSGWVGQARVSVVVRYRREWRCRGWISQGCSEEPVQGGSAGAQGRRGGWMGQDTGGR